MKITKIRASRGVTIGMPNFSSARFDRSAEAELGKKDDPDECMAKLNRFVTGHVVEDTANAGFEYPLLDAPPVLDLAGMKEPEGG